MRRLLWSSVIGLTIAAAGMACLLAGDFGPGDHADALGRIGLTVTFIHMALYTHLFGDFTTGSVTVNIVLMTAIAAVHWTLLTCIVWSVLAAVVRAAPPVKAADTSNESSRG